MWSKDEALVAPCSSPTSPAQHGRPFQWVELACPHFGFMEQAKLVQHQLILLHPVLEVCEDARGLPKAVHS